MSRVKTLDDATTAIKGRRYKELARVRSGNTTLLFVQFEDGTAALATGGIGTQAVFLFEARQIKDIAQAARLAGVLAQAA